MEQEETTLTHKPWNICQVPQWEFACIKIREPCHCKQWSSQNEEENSYIIHDLIDGLLQIERDEKVL